MAKRIAFIVKSTTAARWTSKNPVLLNGEIGVESDTGKMKYGDGSTAWSGLPYTRGTIPAHEFDGTQLRFENPNGTWGSYVELGESNTGVVLSDNGDGTVDLRFEWTQGVNQTVTTPDIREENSGVTLTDNGDGTLNLTFSWKYGPDQTITTPDIVNDIETITSSLNLDGSMDLVFGQQYGSNVIVTTPVIQEQLDTLTLTENLDGTADLNFDFRIGGSKTVTTPDLLNNVVSSTETFDPATGELTLDFVFDYGTATFTTGDLREVIQSVTLGARTDTTIPITLAFKHGNDQTLNADIVEKATAVQWVSQGDGTHTLEFTFDKGGVVATPPIDIENNIDEANTGITYDANTGELTLTFAFETGEVVSYTTPDIRGNIESTSAIDIGGGYGSAGTTIDSTGNVSANGNLIIDGTATIGGTGGTDLLTYIDETKFLPVGSIMMFDGTTWTDDSTLPGWYAMIPENEDGGSNGLSFGIQSMVDRFVMGGSAAGATGGTNSYQLTTGQLPSHEHTINHDHGSFTSASQNTSHNHYTSSTTNTTGSHGHNLNYNATTGGGGIGTGNPGATNQTKTGIVQSNGNHSHSYSDYTGNQRSSHQHTIDVPNYTGNSGSTGSGDSVDNRPAYYSMIFIRKCA